MKIIITEEQRKLLFENDSSNYDEFSTVLQTYYTDGVLEFDLDSIDDEKLFFIFESMLKIIDELKEYKIKSDDYVNVENIGYNSDKQLCYFDLGFGDGFEEFDDQPKEVSLNELDLKIDDDTLKKILTKYSDKETKLIGDGGGFGSAYDLGNGDVLKITTDKSEAINSKKIIGKETKHLDKIFDVKLIKLSEKVFYLIHLEKLIIDPYMRSEWVRINDLVLDHMDTNIDRNILTLINKKNPFVAEFLNHMCDYGTKNTWEKYIEKTKEFPQLDFNDISEISTWIKGSVTNDHFIDDEPSEEIMNLVSSLI